MYNNKEKISTCNHICLNIIYADEVTHTIHPQICFPSRTRTGYLYKVQSSNATNALIRKQQNKNAHTHTCKKKKKIPATMAKSFTKTLHCTALQKGKYIHIMWKGLGNAVQLLLTFLQQALELSVYRLKSAVKLCSI